MRLLDRGKMPTQINGFIESLSNRHRTRDGGGAEMAL
jgi:hypothetical protein